MWRYAVVVAVLLAVGAASGARAGEPAGTPGEGPSLTVYSSADPAGFDPEQALAARRAGGWGWRPYGNAVPGFGVVKEVRAVDLAAGVQDLSFTDVAEFIDPTTVSFADLDSPAGTAVLEQAFRFDLASPDKILERYLDRTIAVETTKDGKAVARVEGRVLSVSRGTIVLETAEGLRYVSSRDPGLRLPALPSGLLTKPTLVWKVAAEAAGRHRVRTTYQTAGLTWRADYNLVLSADATKADLGAWVTLLNLSGATYRDARLKLIAGDVQRIRPSSGWDADGDFGALSEDKAASHGFEEKTFFEYHLYTLPRRVDVVDASTQQIPLFPTATGVAVTKVLVYDGLPEAASWGVFPEPRLDRDVRSQANPKLDVYLRFVNEKANGLGVPLPRGKVRAYQRDDADGTLEFVGEDLIDHTPKDETVLVKMGQAFDVVGDRTQTGFALDTSRKTLVEGYRIQLRNHKAAAVRVVVQEHLFRWATSEITKSSDPATKVDARTVRFEVEVPADGERSVDYVVRYTW